MNPLLLSLTANLLLVNAGFAAIVAHYSFDADFSDTSGQGRNGSLVDNGIVDNTMIDASEGGSQFGGGAISFGTDRDYLVIPEIQFGETEDYTIAFWAKLAGTSQALCIIGGDLNDTRDFIGIFTDGRGVRFRDSSNNTTDIAWAPNDESWHHFTFVVYSNTETGNRELQLYVDGTPGLPVVIPSGRFQLNTIGDGYSSSGYSMRGNLDEFWVFDAALAASEVEMLYAYNMNDQGPGMSVPPEEAETITRLRVILQAGQSNSDGRAAKSGLPVSPIDLRAPQPDVSVYHQPESSDVTKGYDQLPSPVLTELQPGLTRISGEFGPEILLGRCYADLYAEEAGTRVAIIKYARGGTNLAVQWQGGGDSTTVGDGLHYRIFQSTVQDGLAALAAAYPEAEIEVEGLVWMQGESDANNFSYANAYEVNLTNFLGDLRLTYGGELPVVIGRLSSAQTGLSHPATVRSAQDAVAAADPRTGIVDTDDLGLASDKIHFDANGQILLGRRFAESLAYFSWMNAQFSSGDIDSGAAEPSADPDGDGLENVKEFLGMSDPLIPQSGLSLDIVVMDSTVELVLPTSSFRQYIFERYVESESGWEAVTDSFRGDDATILRTFDRVEERALYRARVFLP